MTKYNQDRLVKLDSNDIVVRRGWFKLLWYLKTLRRSILICIKYNLNISTHWHMRIICTKKAF